MIFGTVCLMLFMSFRLELTSGLSGVVGQWRGGVKRFRQRADPVDRDLIVRKRLALQIGILVLGS